MMANNNPQVELMTIWGYTKEEIERRWKVTQRFDLLNRFSGSTKGSDKGTKSSPPPTNNSEQAWNILDRLLPPSENETPA